MDPSSSSSSSSIPPEFANEFTHSFALDPTASNQLGIIKAPDIPPNPPPSKTPRTPKKHKDPATFLDIGETDDNNNNNNNNNNNRTHQPVSIPASTSEDLTRTLITEQEISKTYLSAKVSQVAYGTFQKRSAAIVVLEFVFHSADYRRQRFKEASIEIDFTDPDGGGKSKGVSAIPLQGTTSSSSSSGSGSGSGVSIAQFAPRLIYGQKKEEEVTWGLEISAGAGIALGPLTAGPNIGLTRESKYSREHKLIIEGSARGVGPNRLFWSLQERKHDGLPPFFSTAFMVFHPKGRKFSAAMRVKASIGFSLDLRRWKVFVPNEDRLWFHEDYPKGGRLVYRDEEEEVGVKGGEGNEDDRDFDRIDFEGLYKRNMARLSAGVTVW